MDKKKLVIMPTYNEEQNIRKLVPEILALPVAFDVLVIDDNSPDNTAGTARELMKGSSRIVLLTRKKKLGLGTAYSEGFKWALENEYAYIFTMDADLSHQPGRLPELAEKLRMHDMVVGSRYVGTGGIEGWTLARRLLSKFGNWYMRLITGLPIKDCTSGFTGMRNELVHEILAGGIRSEGYAFLIELKHLALRTGYSAQEIPILFTDRIAGKSKISKKIIFEAIVLAWKLLFTFGRLKKTSDRRAGASG